MGEITQPWLIHLKGWLFAVLGMLCGGLILARDRSFGEIALLGVCVWAFARAYYYAFYVIEKYVDPTYKFDGLTSYFRYMLSKKNPRA